MVYSILHTKEGAKVACHVLGYGKAKDRKVNSSPFSPLPSSLYSSSFSLPPLVPLSPLCPLPYSLFPRLFSLSPSFSPLLNSKCVFFLKVMVKSFKSYILKMAKEEFGHMVLLKAFECVDDTALLNKVIISVSFRFRFCFHLFCVFVRFMSILKELTEGTNLLEAVKDKHGRLVVFAAMETPTTKYYHPVTSSSVLILFCISLIFDLFLAPCRRLLMF